MNPFSLSISGGNLPHNNMMPFLCLTFIIALQGVFPARG
jgi:microcystin-dependent protein